MRPLFSSRSSGSLLILWAIVAIALASSYPIASSSEAREAHVIAAILGLHGAGTHLPELSTSPDVATSTMVSHWLFPTRGGQIPSKPPLFHWLGASVGWVAGSAAPWVGRLISILSGLVLVLATMRLARLVTSDWWLTDDPHRNDRWNPQNEATVGDGTVVRLAGLMVLASHLFVNLSLNIRVDMVFAALSTGSLAVILPHMRDRQTWRKRGWGCEFALWFLIGCAVLARGPVGVVLPTTILFSAIWIRLGGWRALRWAILPPLPAVLAIVIPLLWYLPAAAHWGFPFLERIFFENADRVAGGAHVNTEAWWFYGPSLVRTCFPWSVVFLVALVRRGYQRRGLGILVGWVVVGLALFSVASGKRHSYLLPILPAIAIISAHYAVWEVRHLSEAKRSRLIHWYLLSEPILLALPLVGLLLVGGTVAGWWSIAGGGAVKPLLRGWLLSSGVVIAVVMVTLTVLRSYLARSAAAGHGSDILTRAFVIGGIVPMVLVALGLGVKNSVKDFPGRTAEIIARVHVVSGRSAQSPPLLIYKSLFEEYLDPLMYYAGVPVEVVTVPEPPEDSPIARMRSQVESSVVLPPEFRRTVVDVLDVLSQSATRAGMAPCDQWLLTTPDVVDTARRAGMYANPVEEFLEPTHRAGISSPRRDRTIVLTRFSGSDTQCLSRGGSLSAPNHRGFSEQILNSGP